MINRVVYQGRLTADPEHKQLGSGRSVCQFVLASNRYYKSKDNEERKEIATFLPCVAWGNLADNASRFLKKGSMVVIEGKLITESWEKDGVKRSKITCQLDEVQFLDRNGATESIEVTPKQVRAVQPDREQASQGGSVFPIPGRRVQPQDTPDDDLAF